MSIIKLSFKTTMIVLAFFMCSCTNKKVEDVVVSKDGVNISFDKKGSDYPPIIFIHGWTNPRTIWDDQVDYFSNNHTSIAIDLAGSGKSGHNRTDWTIKAFSNDVIAVMDKLELDKVVLVGFSMGAMVAVETANQIPNRVLGLVVVDELKYPDRQFPKEMIPVMINKLLFMERTNENLIAGGFYKRNHEVVFKRITKLYDGVSTVGWKESLEGAIAWVNEDQKASLKKLKVPYRGIYSDKEPFEMDSIKAYVPLFKGEIIANTGHLVFWDDPEKFNALLEQDIKEFVE